MKKRIMTLMTGMLLLLTACGQTGDRSASTMLPVAAVQSAAQAIAPVEDKVQEDTESLSAEETVEETKDVGDEETPNPTEDAETPSTKAEGTPSAPAGESQPAVPEQPTVPGQAEISAPQPEPAPMLWEWLPARLMQLMYIAFPMTEPVAFATAPGLTIQRPKSPPAMSAPPLAAAVVKPCTKSALTNVPAM